MIVDVCVIKSALIADIAEAAVPRLDMLNRVLVRHRRGSYYQDWPWSHVAEILAAIKGRRAAIRADLARLTGQAVPEAPEAPEPPQPIPDPAPRIIVPAGPFTLAQGEHYGYHDPSRDGYFSLLWVEGDGKEQRSHRLELLPSVLAATPLNRDTWIGQNEFTRPCRRAVHVLHIPLCFVDLDTYAVGVKGDPEVLARRVVAHCREEGVPVPSLIVYSGRGLQAKWLFDRPIPRQALPRWNLCQKTLVAKLALYGADANARDVSRVLRLEGSINSKSGHIVRVVHIEQRDGAPLTYGFDALADQVLPVARQLIIDERKRWAAIKLEREAERALRPARGPRLQLIEGGRQPGQLRRLPDTQLAWDRLNDLRLLARIRGGIKPGERMTYLFWMINFLLLSGATRHDEMHKEALALARRIDPSWTLDESALSTLHDKARQYADRRPVEYNGRLLPALYTPTNARLIEIFSISSDEQKQLVTIIDDDEKKKRHRDRDTERRRAAGAVDRETYLSQALSTQKPWERLGVSRATWYRMGKPGAAEAVIEVPETHLRAG